MTMRAPPLKNALPDIKTKFAAKNGKGWEYGYWHQQKKYVVGHASTMHEAMIANCMDIRETVDLRPAYMK